MSVKPISPRDIDVALPDFVIEAVNTLIRENYRGGEFTVKRDEMVDEMIKHSPTLVRETIFDKHYLDFEVVYREHGWNVTYHSADYTEDPYPPYFKFKPL